MFLGIPIVQDATIIEIKVLHAYEIIEGFIL